MMQDPSITWRDKAYIENTTTSCNFPFGISHHLASPLTDLMERASTYPECRNCEISTIKLADLDTRYNTQKHEHGETDFPGKTSQIAGNG